MTIETAKQLKELGWDKETEKYWNELYKDIFPKNQSITNHPAVFPYPSLEELLNAIPFFITVDGDNFYFELNKVSADEYTSGYVYGEMYVWQIESMKKHPDPTEAVAMLWIKLRKEGIV